MAELISHSEWPGQTIDNRYHVTKMLGEGGMGYVYLATDTRLNTNVVLKVLRQEMLVDPEFRQRFVEEIRALVHLSHPHIVKVSDFGTFHGVPFAVMQYLPGGSLEDRRPKDENGKPKAVAASTLKIWLPAVAGALDFIHLKKYIHRDIKPGNILFDSQKHAFISDFGIAKVAESGSKARTGNLTGVGAVIGTPEYLAPEVIMGQAFDGRIDQYALAVTIYEVLSGAVPFQGNSPTATLVMHTQAPATPLHEIRSSVPKALGIAIERAMAKDPDQRFGSCTEFASACLSALEQASKPAVPSAPAGTRKSSVEFTLPRETMVSAPPVLPAVSPLISNPEAKAPRSPIVWISGGVLGLLSLIALAVVSRFVVTQTKARAPGPTELVSNKGAKTDVPSKSKNKDEPQKPVAQAPSAPVGIKPDTNLKKPEPETPKPEKKNVSFSIRAIPKAECLAGQLESIRIEVDRSGGYNGKVKLTLVSNDAKELVSKDVIRGSGLIKAGDTSGIMQILTSKDSPVGDRRVTVRAEAEDSVPPAVIAPLELRIKGLQKIRDFLGHPGEITALAFSPREDRFLAGTSMGMVVCRDVERDHKHWMEVRHVGSVGAVGFDSEGVWALSGGREDKKLAVMDATQGKQNVEIKSKSHTNGITRVFCLNKDDALPSFSPQSQSSVPFFPRNSQNPKPFFTLKKCTGKTPCSVSEDETIYWDTQTGKPLLVSYDPVLFKDGRLAGTKNEVFAIGKGESLASSKYPVSASKAYSEDLKGKRCLGLDNMGQITLWDNNRMAPGFPWKPGEDTVTTVAISPNGRRMLVGLKNNGQGMIRLYELP